MIDRRKIREMAARWTDKEEAWDGRPTEDLLASFGGTVARMVRREERDGRLALATELSAAKERERRGLVRLEVGPAGIPPPKGFRMVRREARR